MGVAQLVELDVFIHYKNQSVVQVHPPTLIIKEKMYE